MSEDEVVVLIASLALGPLAWMVWSLRLLGPAAARRSRAELMLLMSVIAVSAVMLLAILQAAASFDVRDSPLYLFFYVALGLAWLRVSEAGLVFAGLSPRDNVIERRNGAAAIAVSGAFLAVMLCFAGGNIGDGPGWWVVVFSAFLSSVSLWTLWMLLDRTSGIIDQVTIDRDPAAGVRLAGFLVAAAIVLGRGVAGDWVSAGDTIADFIATAWPVVPLVAVAAAIELRARPTKDRPSAPLVAFGIAPAVLYLAGAIAYVAQIGIPS